MIYYKVVVYNAESISNPRKRERERERGRLLQQRINAPMKTKRKKGKKNVERREREKGGWER